MSVAHIVVDYQNIHLTGHDVWCPEGESAHLCLVHPLHYANQVLSVRNMVRRLAAERAGQTARPDLQLGSVHSYRGLPSNKHESRKYRRSLAQRSEWTKDSRSQVNYRPLKYYPRGGGRFDVQEKGIDVMVALDVVVKAASLGEGDVVILASHDTDLEPALDVAARLAPGAVETTGWMGSKKLGTNGSSAWHTALNEDAFVRSRDLKDYT